MDRFSELETFVAVAEAGGFNAAARALGRSPPSVTRLVAGLEDRIGTRLFNRTTRQIALTEAGQRLLADARRILEDLASAEASAAGAHEEPQGELTVTAPVIFGRRYIAPVLRAFLDRHSRVTGRAILLDRVVDLIEEGIDVAVRIGDLPDSSLTAVRVGDLRRVVVASPEYLRQHGAPQHPSDLAAHRIVLSASLQSDQAWEFHAGASVVSVPVSPLLRGNNIDMTLDAAREGWAVTRAMSYQVADALAAGDLVEVLADFEDRLAPIHLIHAEGSLRAAKIRAFLDFAAKDLRQKAKAWIARGGAG